MTMEKEHIVSLLVGVVAILFIVGGYASFSGLSVASNPLTIEMGRTEYSQGDILDATAVVGPVTLLSDESIVIYLDGETAGIIPIKQYLDSNGIEYGSEIKNLGQNSQEILTLKENLRIHLADYVSLQYMQAGTRHVLHIEMSQGDAQAEEVFRIE